MSSNMFLKLEGVDGESKADYAQKEMELYSYSWGVATPISQSASSDGSLSAGKASFSSLSVTKRLDSSTPLLMSNCAKGVHHPTAILSLWRTGGGDKPELYMQYEMEDVLIESVSDGGGIGDIPTESINLAYGKIILKYDPTKVTGGKGGGVIPKGWDLRTNKPV